MSERSRSSVAGRVLSTFALLLAALAAFLVPQSAPDVAPARRTTPHAYVYDPQCAAGVTRDANPERGPPPARAPVTTNAGVDPGLHACSACSGPSTKPVAYTYDDPSGLAQDADNEVAASEMSLGARWDRGLAQRCRVAAKSVPTVTFSRSRAPGIAGNFDNAVDNGAPTSLTRVGDATRKANRRDALRGQPRAPAGQSLDEYPFACSAQGGCGSFVRSVPVGEQRYQGGVLSQFFQM